MDELSVRRASAPEYQKAPAGWTRAFLLASTDIAPLAADVDVQMIIVVIIMMMVMTTIPIVVMPDLCVTMGIVCTDDRVMAASIDAHFIRRCKIHGRQNEATSNGDFCQSHRISPFFL